MLKKLKQMCCQGDSVEEISPQQTCGHCYRTHQKPVRRTLSLSAAALRPL